MANPKNECRKTSLATFSWDSTCIDCDACDEIAPSVFGSR